MNIECIENVTVAKKRRQKWQKRKWSHCIIDLFIDFIGS